MHHQTPRSDDTQRSGKREALETFIMRRELLRPSIRLAFGKAVLAWLGAKGIAPVRERGHKARRAKRAERHIGVNIYIREQG